MPDYFNLQKQIEFGKEMKLNGWTVEYSQNSDYMGVDYKWTAPNGVIFRSSSINIPSMLAIQKYLNEKENP